MNDDQSRTVAQAIIIFFGLALFGFGLIKLNNKANADIAASKAQVRIAVALERMAK